jgi:uncharacterized cupin superfamily protein
LTLRKTKLSEIRDFDYSFGGSIHARMGDVGRTLGSKTIGLTIQTVAPGCFSSRRHRHVFQEEILVVMEGEGTLHHGDERVPVSPGECVCYLPEDEELHCFENTGSSDLIIWAFGNRFPYEIAIYPDQGVAFVEGLGSEIPLSGASPSEWTEEKRKR